jgi:membrane associated rhomboid family serine protease
VLPIRDQLPTRIIPFVNYGLILANVAVFCLEIVPLGRGEVIDWTASFALLPAQLVAHPIENVTALFSHMFLHSGLAHLGGNMLFLWIFGDNVEDALGHARYLAFYLGCGLVAALAFVALNLNSMVPMLGASGAISGVLAAYALLYPRSPITVINPVPLLWLFWGLFLYLPAWFVVAEYFVVNLWSAMQPGSDRAGVAFAAHIGGFLAGAILLPLLRKNAPVDHDRWERLARPRRRYD